MRRWLRWPLGAFVGTALVLAGVGAFLISTGFDEDPAVTLARGDRPVNVSAGDPGDISANNSPSLARNPVNRRNLAVANRIDTPAFSCALHVSTDDGDRWSRAEVPIPEGEEPKCYAPDVAFAADGTLHVSYVTLRGRGNVPNAVWLVSSSDGGRTLSEPRRLLGPLAFQVRLAADPEKPERLYLTWLAAKDVGIYRFTEPGSPINIARSDDGGRAWSRPVRVSSPARGRVVAPSLAVGRGDDVYVLYLDVVGDRLDYEGAHGGAGGPPYPGPWRLILGISADAGATWSESVVEDRLVPAERFIAFLPPFPSIALDRDSGRVYAAFHDGRLGGEPDVWLWSREPGEREWGDPTRVNDTSDRDGTSQYLPRVAVAPDGRVDVVYYDRRGDPDRNVRTEVSFQSSFDQGETFSDRLTLSSRQFDSRIGFGSERELPELGSRIGLISDDSAAMAVWSDTRAGTIASNKQDLARAVVELSDPARLSDPVKYGLRYGGIAVALAGIALLVLVIRRPRMRR